MKRVLCALLSAVIIISSLCFSVCASELVTDENGVEYNIISSGAVIGEVSYQAEVAGYKGENADVVIPKTISYADKACPVVEITAGAFEKSFIRSIQVNGVNVGIEEGAFYGCTNLEQAVLNDTVVIDESAFENNTSLTRLDLGDSLEVVRDSAFYACSSLEKVNFPKSITEIDTGAFLGCNKLSSFTVEEGCPYFSDYNGILYTADFEMLYLAPMAVNSIEISSDTKIIGEYAFRECLVDCILIPVGVESIADGAFANCSHLEEIDIPETTQYIGDGVFDGIDRCVSVFAQKGSYPYKYISENYGNFNFPQVTLATQKNCSIKLEAETFRCQNAGDTFTPKVLSVSINGVEVNDKYYTVSYSNNTGKGVGNVDVKFQGRYSGFAQKKFTIKGISLAQAKIVLKSQNLTYNGKAQKAQVNYVTLNGSKIPLDEYTCTSQSSVATGSYTVTVNPTAESPYDDSVSTRFYIKPTAPTSLRISKYETSALTVSWNKVAAAQNITGYVIYNNSKKVKTVASSVNSVRITGLKPGTAYTFKVYAYKKCSDSTVLYSPAVTLARATKPTKVSQKALTSPKTRQLRVSWSKVSSCTGYQIAYSTSSKFTSKTTKYTAVSYKTLSKTLTLAKKKRYYVKVRAYKSVGKVNIYSDWSTARTAVTK